MNLGLLIIDSDLSSAILSDAGKMIRALSFKGYIVKSTFFINPDSDIENALTAIKKDAGAILVFGKFGAVRAYYAQNYDIAQDARVFEIEETVCAFMDSYDEKFINEILIPALNSKCRTFYDTFVIKTFNKTEKQLRELLSEYIKNRNKITFSFSQSLMECDINIRYSSKMSKPLVDYIIDGVSKTVSEFAYAYSDTALPQRAAEVLTAAKAKLSVAESFTGGAIAAALVKIPGISSVFKEGIVSYSNESKINRLNVSKDIISAFGAVSIETVYEMAANSLWQSGSDYCVATTGNAGPSSEKDGECGVCFIAAGNKNGIHIFKYVFPGTREEVIECGVKAALYHLVKKISQDIKNLPVENATVM